MDSVVGGAGSADDGAASLLGAAAGVGAASAGFVWICVERGSNGKVVDCFLLVDGAFGGVTAGGTGVGSVGVAANV